ncbi:MAG: 50S ribosomal protein L2 [Thermoplasmatales archaeon]|nr:50S ribosomal protein L2 [Thermoplasmatales archaeon]
MGKRLIQQRRGRTQSKFNAPSHRFRGEIKYARDNENKEGIVKDIIHDPGRSAPLASIMLNDNKKILVLASEGIKVGDKIKFTDNKKEIRVGNVLPVGKIPEGAPICNIELSPGDGGKLVRAGGSNATVVSQDKKKTVIQLPSGQFKTLDSTCKATVGIIAGGGRRDKPFLKAGKKHIAYKKRGKQYPIVRGVAMCAVSHPHGGGGHQHVGKPSTVKRGASPGRKVGSIAAKRTGRK